MRHFSALFFCLLSSAAFADQETGELLVHVSGATPGQGQVLIALFNSETSYMREPHSKGKEKVDASGEATLRFESLVPGVYALSVIYDINNNGELDKGLFGVPKEEFGFSNNAKGRFGPPQWGAARFTVDSSLTEQKILLTRAER